MTIPESDNPVMYHFTNASAWEQMNDGCKNLVYDFETNRYRHKTEFDLTGLLPMGSVIKYKILPGLPLETYAPSSFGILNLQSWVNNYEFSKVLDILLGNIGNVGENIILLEIDLINEDKPYVYERAHVERLRQIPYDDSDGDVSNNEIFSGPIFDFFRSLFLKSKSEPISLEERWNVKVKDAYFKYWGSRVPLSDYDGSYSLAEVVVQKQIPLERIRLIKEFD
ncbi:MAG: hypothetical protein GQ477_03985 [Nanohaloarchaea archaeon]|nr:hypothetical protein [Candidatus Nanohaloarchaea archaeon]